MNGQFLLLLLCLSESVRCVGSEYIIYLNQFE